MNQRSFSTRLLSHNKHSRCTINLLAFSRNRPSGESSEPFAPANEVVWRVGSTGCVVRTRRMSKDRWSYRVEPYLWKPTKLSERITR